MAHSHGEAVDPWRVEPHFSLIFCDVNCDSDGQGLTDVNLLDWNLAWKSMQ
jgi:hypothetical protein